MRLLEKQENGILRDGVQKEKPGKEEMKSILTRKRKIQKNIKLMH